jgi:DNA (cytosine-5)-methyltransferase 1
VLTHGSLFTGIAGFDLGFERCGMVTKWQVEIDPKLRARLAGRFPGAKQYADIRECGAHNLERVDVISGGFPCQPFSQAGRRAGKDDNRYLWPEMLRVISALRPTFVVAENVSGLLSLEDGRVLDEVYSSLEAEAYETLPPLVLPACAFGARHRRDRIWIIAHAIDRGSQERRPQGFAEMERGHREGQAAGDFGAEIAESGSFHPHTESRTRQRETSGTSGHAAFVEQGTTCHASIEGFPDWAGGTVGQPSPLTEFERPGGEDVDDSEGERRGVCESANIGQAEGEINAPSNPSPMRDRSEVREIERDFRGVAHGVSARVDRLKGLGNAIVPQIAEWIGKRIADSITQGRD